jgi:hypothetical protein
MPKKDNPRKEKEEYVMVCPKCKSPDVESDRTNPLQPAMGLPQIYLCNRCGHSGPNFPEVELSELEHFETEAKKEKLVDTKEDATPKVDSRYGVFEVRVLWKITGPVILLLGILLAFKEFILGAIAILFGLVMIYITYFKKRNIKVD